MKSETETYGGRESRRSFMKKTAIAGAALVTARFVSLAEDASNNPTGLTSAAQNVYKKPEDWCLQAMRWGQNNVLENEASKFDVAWWEDIWRRSHIDGIVLNAGGHVAYYPTQLEDQHKSPWLGGRDLFGELVVAARRRKLRILARVDPSISHPDVYARHPEWFACDPKGKPYREDSEDKEDIFYIICINSGYFSEFVPAIMQEIIGRYDVDGFFFNQWWGRGKLCYCSRCREMFLKETGCQLPVGPAARKAQTAEAPDLAAIEAPADDPRNMVWKQWIKWQEKRLGELSLFWNETTRKLKPGTVWIGNSSNRGFLADYEDMCKLDFQSREGNDPLFLVGQAGKMMQAKTQGRVPCFHNISGNTYSRLVAKPALEHQLFIANAIMANSRPWFDIKEGILDDKRQVKPMIPMFQWDFENQEFLRDRQSMAEIGVVYYEKTDRGRFLPPERQVDNEFQGIYYGLMRNRIPFDLVQVARMDKAILSRYKLLLLPDVAAISETEAQSLREFVEQGGALIATRETGRYDEWGNPREQGVLDDVLGIAAHLPSPGQLTHSHMRIEKRDHPLFSGLEDTDILLNTERYEGGTISSVTAAEGTDDSLLRLIPPVPSWPAEEAYSRSGDANVPLVLLKKANGTRGATIYWASELGSLIWTTNLPDHLRLLANSLRWALPEPLSLEVAGTGLVDMHPYRQQGCVQVHMVNLNSPDVWKAPMQEISPVGPQEIRWRIPQGMKFASKATCLVSGRELDVPVSQGKAVVVLPEIKIHEVVVIPLV